MKDDLTPKIDIPMPIETPRLILRPAQVSHAAAMHEAKLETWDQLQQWMPWAKEKSSVAEDEKMLVERQEEFAKRTNFMLFGFEKASGRFVIGTGLHRFDWAVRRFEIGYWVRKSAQGQGYATESTNALTRYAFWQLHARAVAIEHAEGNDKSRNVIEKLGFEKEGVLRNEILLPDGSVTNRHMYSRIDLDGLPDLKVSWPAQS